MNVHGVTKDQLPDVIRFVAPYFESFASRSHGRETAKGFLLRVQEQRAQMWLCVEDDTLFAVALTQIKGPVVEIVACAGKHRERWRDALLDEIEAWARHIGAAQVMPVVRPGWAKWLASRGYRETHREMCRRLA